MSATSKSGIRTTADGSSVIPSSQRADGSTRKEIRVRPGYRPPEDVETYKNRSAEAWKSRGSGGVPGADDAQAVRDSDESKSKNAKRRLAARRKQDAENQALTVDEAPDAADNTSASATNTIVDNKGSSSQQKIAGDEAMDLEIERQKKIRNHLKKLRAVRELKDKKAKGEKLSHDQLMKVSKEEELLRDLRKLNFEGPELEPNADVEGTTRNGTG